MEEIARRRGELGDDHFRTAILIAGGFHGRGRSSLPWGGMSVRLQRRSDDWYEARQHAMWAMFCDDGGTDNRSAGENSGAQMSTHDELF